jgi:6-phosphogluconolactonase (cycloisomerase 2 family)
MHARRRFVTFVALIALVLASSLTASYAALAWNVVGHVYVNDNSAPNNAIAAFDRHADGSLTPMSGSPFITGGAGAATAVSQGALQLSSDGRYLLAVDSGSNQISVLRIRHDGSLRPVHGSPVGSRGILPVSIAVHGSLVVVANDGDSTGGANYTGFFLTPGGHLIPLPGATFALPAPTQWAKSNSARTEVTRSAPGSTARSSTASR